MSAVKRHLEDLTDELLDSVRLFGSAVIVSATEPEPLLRWLQSQTEGGAYTLLSRALGTLERQWLCGPSREARKRLDSATAALESSRIPERNVTVPPLEEADALSNWREALEDCVGEAVEALSEWLEPWGLQLCWEAVGLCAVPLDDEWATAVEQGLWQKRRGANSEH